MNPPTPNTPALKYAVVGDEFIETGWHDTEAEAIAEFDRNSDAPFSDPDNDHFKVQSYTAAEIAEIEAYAEAHPQ